MGEVVELERQREGKSWLNQRRKGNEREGGREGGRNSWMKIKKGRLWRGRWLARCGEGNEG